MPQPAAPRAVLSPLLAALTLGWLLGLQPISTDLYLPALPALTRDLGASMSQAQLTMSGLILAFGIAQLFWGPVADRVGRRPVLLTALSLFTLASVAAALAPDIGWLMLARIAQGASLAASVVCGRAMVRDLYEPHEGARVMSQAMSGLGVIAVAGPVAGGALAAHWGWRGALALVALAVGAALLFVWRCVPETIRVRNPHATRLRPLALTAASVLRHPTFLSWALLAASSYGGLFTTLAASSFVYINWLGFTPAAYGLALASAAGAYGVGTVYCRRWLPRFGLAGTVRRAAWFSLAGGLLMAGGVALGLKAWWAVLVPQWLFCFGHGSHQTCGQVGAVGPFPHAAGVASALAGCLLSLVAFGIGLALGLVQGDDAGPMAYGVAIWSLAVAALAWTLVQRHGQPVPAAARAAT